MSPREGRTGWIDLMHMTNNTDSASGDETKQRITITITTFILELSSSDPTQLPMSKAELKAQLRVRDGVWVRTPSTIDCSYLRHLVSR